MNGIPIGGIVVSIISFALTLSALGVVKWVLGLRRVVPPGEVHIVQSKAAGRVTYGKLPEDVEGKEKGDTKILNTYYEWPMWLPQVGVQVSKMDLSVFDQALEDYKAYDSKRAPFVVDVMAFYRIADPQLAADRIKDMATLHKQLNSSLKSAIRKILAEFSIDEIMAGRSEFGQKFTQELDDDLKAWGVKTVKNVELMDIRDDSDEDEGGVISAIQARHTSFIKRESRVEVAENNRAAQEAEIQANRQVAIQRQDAERQVGEREAETKKLVGIAKQKAEQEVAASEQQTVVAQMEVKREESERLATIDKSVKLIEAARDKEVQIIAAERDKQVQITNAERDKTVRVTNATAESEALAKQSEGEKTKMINIADGNLALATKEAEGLRAKGEAEGAAATAIAMAPVKAQLELATGIGQNKEYQEFVVRQKSVDASMEVGLQQAKSMGEALGKAKIKVLSNLGGGSSGIGQQLGALLEGFGMTGMGNSLLSKVGIKTTNSFDDDDETPLPGDSASLEATPERPRIPLKERVKRNGGNGAAAD